MSIDSRNYHNFITILPAGVGVKLFDRRSEFIPTRPRAVHAFVVTDTWKPNVLPW